MTQPDNAVTQPDNANGLGGQHDPDDQAGHRAPTGGNGTATPDSEHDDGENSDEHDDEGDSAARKARREAAGLRRRLREVESERDQLAEQLDAARQDILSQIATDAGLPDHGLLAAAGYEIASFITEDGRVDRVAAIDACRDTMKRYRIARSPAPNMQQATGTRMPGQSGSDAFTAAFAPPKA